MGGWLAAGNLDFTDGVYTGGDVIELASTKGRIEQKEGSVLAARSVTAKGGKGIMLTSTGNQFREFTAEGASTGEAGGQSGKGNGIYGNVEVRTYAGENLRAGIASKPVYGNVAFTNLDAGSLTVTTDIAAKAGKDDGGGNITFRQEGDILAQGTLQADGNVSVRAENGDVAVGLVDAASVSLSSGREEGHVTADTIRVEARGNGNGTGEEDIGLSGSYVTVRSIVNKNNGRAPLTLSTAGASKDRAVKYFGIGVQNGDGSYTGGIQSSSGAVIQQLWTDQGLVYMAGDSNLHISKLVVNERLHAANDKVTVSVYGRVAIHDGERVVFWNDSIRNVPDSMQDRWYSGSYSDPSWMRLDLFGNGDIRYENGFLVYARNYPRISGVGDSIGNRLSRQLDNEPDREGVVYFDRNNLIQIDEDAYAVHEGSVTVE